MFGLHLEHAHCCREQDRGWAVASHLEVHKTPNNWATTPSGCHAKCLSTSRCHFFSHSVRWGNCFFCSGCRPANNSGDAAYTSWRRLVAPTAESPDACTHDALWPLAPNCLQSPLYGVNVTSADGCLTMAVRPHDIVSHGLEKRGMWEIRSADELAELSDDGVLLPPTGVFLDVGSNLGWYSLLFAQRGYRVVAIDAMRSNVEALRATLCLHPSLQSRVTVVETALSSPENVAKQADQPCVMRLHDSRNLGNGILDCSPNASTATACLLPKPGRRVSRPRAGRCHAVRLSTLDTILADARPERIDVVKFDIEGHECPVLSGAHTLFERYRPRLVQLEGKRKRILVCARAIATKFDYIMGTRRGFDGNFVLYDARVVASRTSQGGLA